MKFNLSVSPEFHCHLSAGQNLRRMPMNVHTVGGDPGLQAALLVMDLENPEKNGEMYDNWASSVKDFPDVVDQKVKQLTQLSISYYLIY